MTDVDMANSSVETDDTSKLFEKTIIEFAASSDATIIGELHPRPKKPRQRKTAKKEEKKAKTAEDFPFITYPQYGNIKFYQNTPAHMREYYQNRIASAKKMAGDLILTPLKATTITVSGAFTIVGETFHFFEEKFMRILTSPTGNIISIGSNFGKMMNPNYVPPAPQQKSTRGRKPKKKRESKRRKHGLGNEFQTQITFEIKNVAMDRVYKIKLFRNGRFQIPGGQNPTLEDFVPPLIELRDFLRPTFGSNLEVDHIAAVMRNYKCKLIDPKIYIDVIKLQKCINAEKNPASYKPYLWAMTAFMKESHMTRLMGMLENFNIMHIGVNNYNADKCFSSIFTFNRQFESGKIQGKKHTTVKVLKTGKIDFDGAKSTEEVEEIYYWLQYVLKKYRSRVLIDITTIVNEEDPDTSDYEGESIYDQDVDDILAPDDMPLKNVTAVEYDLCEYVRAELEELAELEKENAAQDLIDKGAAPL